MEKLTKKKVTNAVRNYQAKQTPTRKRTKLSDKNIAAKKNPLIKGKKKLPRT